MDGNEVRENVIEEKKKISIKERVKNAATTVWNGAKGAAHWVVDNKNDLLLVGGGVATVIAIFKGKSSCGGRSFRREEDRDYRVYDARTGQYYYLKRRMNNREKMELDYRLESGERMGFILDDMGLLRRY